MPKLTRAIPDEMLLGAGVHELDPGLPLIAAQAGMLLGRSKSRMDDDRRDNKPPPAHKDGGKIKYRLGDVLSERARVQGKSLAEVAKEQADYRRGWPSFAAFIASGTLHDTWPIATVRGCPVDALATLGVVLEDNDLGEIEEMSLEDFLFRRLNFAQLQERDREREKLDNATSGPDLPHRPRGGL